MIQKSAWLFPPSRLGSIISEVPRPADARRALPFHPGCSVTLANELGSEAFGQSCWAHELIHASGSRLTHPGGIEMIRGVGIALRLIALLLATLSQGAW